MAIKGNYMRPLVGLVSLVSLVLFASLGCSSAQSTATPLPPVQPAPAVAPPAAATAPTAVGVPGAPAPTVVAATPTRALPTSTPASTGGPQYGGTLRYACCVIQDNLDPHYTVRADTYKVLWALYDQLIHLDAKGDLVPELAESWSISADGKTITFNLRKGVKFHDGTPFNAQAVKLNFDRMLDPNESSPRKVELTPYVQKVGVVDDNTFTVQLFAPLRPFLATLGSDRVGFIVSPTAVQKYGKDFGRYPVGTGAFTLSEWVPDIRWVVKRNASFWDKTKPYLDNVAFIGAPEQSVMLALLRTGEADMIEAPRPQDIPIVQANPNLDVGRMSGYRTTALHFNPSKPPFNNKALRQAIAYAVDGKKFSELAYPNAGRQVYVLERLGYAYNPDLKPMGFDQSKAKQKLAEAGFPNGVTIPSTCSSGSASIEQCDIVHAMLDQVGIKTTTRVILASDYYAAKGGFYVEVGLGPATAMARRTDPHINIQRYFQTGAGNNYGNGYSNKELDKLIEDAATEYDVAKARALYTRIQQIIVGDDTIHVPYNEYDEFYPHTKAVQGFVPRIHGRTIVRELWLSK